MRSQRDAVGCLATAHIKLEQSCGPSANKKMTSFSLSNLRGISADLVDGQANFASAVAQASEMFSSFHLSAAFSKAMLTEMPRRMEAAEVGCGVCFKNTHAGFY